MIENTPIKTPSSWHTSEFKKIVLAFGERSTFMILMEEEQKQFVILCDFRLNNNVIWFTALHSTEYSIDDQIIDMQLFKVGNQFQFLAAVQTTKSLDMINYYMRDHGVNDQRVVFDAPGTLYSLIFIKGFYFMIFSNGSISHLNHTYFFTFKLK